VTNTTATMRNSSQMVLARHFALCRRVALAYVALALSFAVFALNRSARASEQTLLAEAPKSQDVVGTNGAGPCQVAKQYVSLINQGQYGALGGLFSDNAVYQGPDGKTRHGSKQIGEFYVKMLTRLRPNMKPASFIEQGNECVMELENKDSEGRYVLTAIDHFTVDQNGKATHFVVYLRPGAPLPNLKDIGK
jgi:SnoaL-like domain